MCLDDSLVPIRGEWIKAIMCLDDSLVPIRGSGLRP
jgi:hypothetical protein